MSYWNHFEQQIFLNPAHQAGMGEPPDERVCNTQKRGYLLAAEASLKMGFPQATQLQ